ncbi:SMC family ATPase [Desulfuromonas sp. AOP6]|uniref:AAA family ATPase n=1 Tax=Desulfuromonas sp. AOP6 TaxID=1566351 RepID=UPI001275E370|nr:SMC family ATPase [Desulfuromonas sp. AOP6]BCA80181.1 nuclease SbcCD subunit C [Desulfuromonas sp. AOP6]
MQILSIHLKNIKSHRDTELTFSPGINVLSGPNGVGKSTIFEAIGYALFGVDAQSFVGNIERFVTIGAKRGEIAVVFQVAAAERYRVSRTVATPSKWLLAKEAGGVFEVEEHKDAKETEARLKELLGLDGGRSLAEQFELVIGPFQHEFLGPFVIKQPAKRRDKFDEILGIDAWRKTFNETKVLTAAIKAKVDSLESAMGPLQNQVAELPVKKKEHREATKALSQVEVDLAAQQQRLKDLETRLLEVDQREKRIKELEREVDGLKVRISNGNELIGKQKLLVDEAVNACKVIEETTPGKKAYEQAEASLATLREQVKVQRRLEQEKAELSTRVGILEERFKVESRAIEKTREDLAAEEKTLAQTREALALDERQQALAAGLPEIRLRLERVRQQLGQLEGRRAGLTEGSEKLAEGICPFFQEPCLNLAEKPADDVFSARFSELDKERQRLLHKIQQFEQEENVASRASDHIKAVAVKFEGLEAQLASLVSRREANERRAEGLAQLQKERASAQHQLEEKLKALEGFRSLQGDIEAAEKEKARHQQARDLYVANQQQAAELVGRRSELEKFENLLKQLHEALTGMETVHRQAGQEYDAAAHEALRRQKDELWGGVNVLGQQVKGLIADVSRLAAEVDKLTQIEKDIASKQEQIRVYREKDDLVRFLRNRVFRNVSGYLSERFREEISQRANRIYRIIAESDEELAWGENYQIVLRDMVDGQLRERADDQLSGGQTMSAVVALRLAMLQTIGARLAFFDEPTSNLDVNRRENLAQAFRAIDVGQEEVTEHWYDQLFLISHDVAFTEVTDQILTLT